MTILDKGVSASPSDQRIRLHREPLSWIADRTFVMPGGGMIPFVLMPGSCSLHRFIVRCETAFPTRHRGSAACIWRCRRGWACPASTRRRWPDAAVPVATPAALPALPDVEFSMVPPRPGESPVVAEVREMLAAQLR